MGNYQIRTGLEAMDIAAIHQYLSAESYWAADIPYDTVEKALRHSFCVGVFCDDMQIGFARLVTDYTTFAYLADVYIEKTHRRKGLSKMLLRFLLALDWVQDLRRVMLATMDAHTLYQQFGFAHADHPERLMEIRRQHLYRRE